MNHEQIPSVGKKKSNITEYNRKSYIIQNFLYLIVFIVILASLTYPWISSRNAAKESIAKIYSEHLTAHTEAITAGIQEFLKQYEVPSRFLAGISDTPDLIECSQSKVYNFIRYCQAARKNLDPKPNLFFFGESESSFCMINWNNTNSTNPDEFHFFYAYHYQLDEFQLNYFNGLNADFNNFQPNGGDNVTTWSEQMKIIYNTNVFNEFSWRNILYFANQKSDDNYLGGAIYVRKSSTDTITISGIGFDISYLYSTLKKIASLSDSKYAFLTMDDTALLLDSGEINPINHTKSSLYIYPTLAATSDPFWQTASSLIGDLKNGSILSSEIDGDKYLFLLKNITVRDISHFQIVVAFNLQKPISNMFFDTTVIFVGGLGLVGLVFFITAFFLRRSKLERSRKLKRVPNLEDEKFKIDKNGGALVRSIHSLRKLQLAYPEDTILNKIADSAILKLARSKDSLFQNPSVSDGEFKSVLRRLSPPPEPAEPPFQMWQVSSGRKLVKAVENNEFLWMENVGQYKPFVKKMILLIVSNSLLFQSIDPDYFVKYMVEVGKSIKNPAHSTLRLSSLIYLITGPLKNTIGSRIDTFAVALSVALLHPVNAENICKRARNIKHYLDLLDEMVPGKGEEREYIREMVRQLLMAADDKHVFDIIGEFAVVSESSEFNITENWDHHMIYMKCLVKLCDFSPYWAPHAIMVEALRSENPYPDMTDEFRDNYHYVVASKIVQPLLTNFTNLVKMEDVSSALTSNILELKCAATKE